MRNKSDIRFYDTCSLLLAGESLFDSEEKFVVSSITFNELEHIKTASNKDADIKYSARILLHLFEEHPDHYEVVVHTHDKEDWIREHSFDLTNDTMILGDAIWCNDNLHIDSTIFVTNDLSLKHIANTYFGDGVLESIREEVDIYTGYKEVHINPNSDLLASFYQDSSNNTFSLNVGEYLIIRDLENNIIDVRVWTGSEYRYLSQNNGF